MENGVVECRSYGDGYLFASKSFVSEMKKEAEATLRYDQNTTSRIQKQYISIMESKRAEFIRYWELAQSHPEELNKKEYTFDNWREISNRFHVTSKTTHHIPSSCPDSFNAKGAQIMKHYHDCKWCCTCTRTKARSKIMYLQPGNKNSGLCDHVMYTGIYKGGMIPRPSDEEDTLRVNKRRGAKKKTNCYFKPPDVPPAPKKLRMRFSMF